MQRAGSGHETSSYAASSRAPVLMHSCNSCHYNSQPPSELNDVGGWGSSPLSWPANRLEEEGILQQAWQRSTVTSHLSSICTLQLLSSSLQSCTCTRPLHPPSTPPSTHPLQEQHRRKKSVIIRLLLVHTPYKYSWLQWMKVLVAIATRRMVKSITTTHILQFFFFPNWLTAWHSKLLIC